MTRKFSLKSRRPVRPIDFASDLNEQQLAVAVAEGGPMLVIAGAGTGKTRALTYRLAHLVHRGVDPARILLVTFTNRAAREMLARAEQLVAADARRIWGGTFHHIGNRILRQHGQCLGISADFSILDREDAGDLLASCVTDAGIEIKERRFPKKALLASISSFCRNTLEPIGTVIAGRFPTFAAEADKIEQVMAHYSVQKQERQLLDYDDLLSAWLKLLQEHEAVRKTLATQFQHILVDEYQDTNAIQSGILDLLAREHRNLCVVGDDAQSIYSFRGANFQNIICFRERYPDATECRLETNYRSTPQILAFANANIANNEVRLEKTLRASRPTGLKPAVVTCIDHFVQSRFIAEYILHLLDEGRELLDIAVLYRSHWHAPEIQLELQRHNIPFEVRGGLRFFEQAHIKDVVGYLRIVHNPLDELAWLRLLRLLPQIGGALSKRIWRHVASAEDPLDEAQKDVAANFLPPPARPHYLQFASLLGRLAKIGNPAEIFERVLEDHYKDYLLTHYDNADQRREDIEGLAAFASQYHTLEAFLSDVSLSGEFSGETCETGPDEQHFVTLSTVHQAKGLEWPVVLMPWIADGRFPTDLAMNTQEELEEERRVFHVAVTRAKDELYLVVPQLWQSGVKKQILMKPSRFLTELPADVTEPMELEETLTDVTSGRVSTGMPG